MNVPPQKIKTNQICVHITQLQAPSTHAVSGPMSQLGVHPRWFSNAWHAVPQFSEVQLDVGSMRYRLHPTAFTSAKSEYL
jgi:nitric oxide synthase oxygenase domain/subunit